MRPMVGSTEKIFKPLVRFYRQKAERVVKGLATFDAFTDLPEMYIPEIITVSDESLIPVDALTILHDWLLKNMYGLGRKATAHLMRNLGLFGMDYDSYPIIDVHILKALNACNFNTRTYQEAENSFRKLARLTGVPVIILDAFLWCTYSNNWNPSTADFDNFSG